jgi:hypothetical protein
LNTPANFINNISDFLISLGGLIYLIAALMGVFMVYRGIRLMMGMPNNTGRIVSPFVGVLYILIGSLMTVFVLMMQITVRTPFSGEGGQISSEVLSQVFSSGVRPSDSKILEYLEIPLVISGPLADIFADGLVAIVVISVLGGAISIMVGTREYLRLQEEGGSFREKDQAKAKILLGIIAISILPLVKGLAHLLIWPLFDMLSS